jgi:D-aspartate ligase
MTGAVGSRQAAARLRVDTPVVVLNTHHSGLAIARDLAPLGVRVIGLTAMAGFHGNRSRFLEYRPSPDSLTEQPQLLRFLLQLASEIPTRAILLPTRDHDINFISRQREALERCFIIPMLKPEALDRVMNKDALAAVASTVGVQTPRTITVDRADGITAAASLRFPCICKPVYASQWRKPGIWEAVGRQKAMRVESFNELESFYSNFMRLDPLVCVQEWIEGEEEDLLIFGSYCSGDGDVVASFTARKRLQYPPLAGTGIVVEALPLPQLEQPSRALLTAINFRGVSEIEYKRDRRSGKLYLIEVNPRHWDQHGLGTQVGVNLSEALYRDVTGQAERNMKQDPGSRLWIAEAEYSRHLVRCLLGRAPMRDATLALGARRTWAVFDGNDLHPFWSLLGLK